MLRICAEPLGVGASLVGTQAIRRLPGQRKIATVKLAFSEEDIPWN